MLGKFAEGDFKSGFKHSLIMVIGGYLIISTAAGLLTATSALVLLIPRDIILRGYNEIK